MASHGYVHADLIRFRRGEVLFAVTGPEVLPYLDQTCASTWAELVAVEVGVDAEGLLRRWPHGPVRFAYLDVGSWPYPDAAPTGVPRSELMRRHLELAKLLVPLAAPDAWVVLTDTWPIPAGWNGKGAEAAELLAGEGWAYVGGHLDIGVQVTGSNAFYVVLRRS